jgi:hypothetical protein
VRTEAGRSAATVSKEQLTTQLVPQQATVAVLSFMAAR